MKLYTKNDIINDIFKFEGVKVSIPINFRSLKLYSEVYSEPFNNNQSDDIVIHRVEGFIQNDFRTILPEVDQEPDPSDNITFYLSNTSEGETKSTRLTHKLCYLKGFKVNDENELKDITLNVMKTVLANTIVLLNHNDCSYKLFHKEKRS